LQVLNKKQVLKTRILLISLLSLSVFNSKAQQIPAYHHYFINGMAFNPAATGYHTTTNAYLMRNQRNLGFEGGNIVNALTVDGSLFENKLGLGISLYSDVIGASSAAGAMLSGSYKVNFSESTFLRFGIAAGAEDYRINYNQAIVKDPNDVELNSFYPSRKIVANVNAGILLQVKKFQFNFSVPQLLGINSELKAMINDGSQTGGGHTFDRHFVGMMRYDFEFSEKLGLKLTPIAMLKFIPGADIYYEGGVTADFRDFVWVNGTYKSGYAVTASAGFRIKKSIVIGYAYDVVLNSSKSLAGINQEILVGYRFPVTSNGKNNDKELDEAKKQIEKLNSDVAVKTKENDSIATKSRADKIAADEAFTKMETEKNDTINKLKDQLAKKKDIVTPPLALDTAKKTPPVKFDNSQIKKSENDYFLELDNSDSPQGLYVVFGAYSKEEGAQTQYNKYKSAFPESRIIINQRNGYRYIIFKYANQPGPVFETKNKAHQMGLTKAWILNYVR
jgi:type IX secretion system PorP/SprF family membrane protein